MTRFGAPTDFGARIALKQWGLVPGKDVTIIQLGGLPEAFAALKGGSVQAVVLPPPFSTEAIRQGMVQLIDFNQSDIEFIGVGLTSTARFVNSHDEATRRVVRALLEGIWAFKGNREATLRAIEKYTRLTDRNILEETYQSNRKIVRLAPGPPRRRSEMSSKRSQIKTREPGVQIRRISTPTVSLMKLSRQVLCGS